MNRKFFLSILSAFLCFLSTWCGSTLAAEPAKPNVLWIYLEDVSGWFGCYGEKLIETPHIDQLAAEGMRFNRFYVTAGVCSAMRSATMLGAMQTSFGVHHHRSSRNIAAGTPHDGVGMIHLPKDVVPLPQLCRAQGVFTFNEGHPKDDFNFVFRREDFYDFCPDERSLGPARTVAGECWSDRKPGQSFFGQVQLYGGKYGIQGRRAEMTQHVDRAAVSVPPYYPAFADELARHRQLLDDWIEETGDRGQQTEDEGGLIQVYYDWGDRCVNPEYDAVKQLGIQPKVSPARVKADAKAAQLLQEAIHAPIQQNTKP